MFTHSWHYCWCVGRCCFGSVLRHTLTFPLLLVARDCISFPMNNRICDKILKCRAGKRERRKRRIAVRIFLLNGRQYTTGTQISGIPSVMYPHIMSPFVPLSRGVHNSWYTITHPGSMLHTLFIVFARRRCGQNW